MEFELVGAPIALYKEFDTGAEKGVEAIRKELGTDFPDLDLNELSQEKANKKIREKTKQVLKTAKKPFFIGGDHSITLPILEAQTIPFDVFWFDAHLDAYDFYKHRLSHATVLRRVSELPKCRKIYLIGSRARELEEKEFLRSSKKVELIKPYQIKRVHSPRYYVTIDIDVLDPKDAPAVDHPEPKGIRIDRLLEEIKRLKRGNLVGADLVELVPDNDNSGITEKNAVKIIKEILK